MKALVQAQICAASMGHEKMGTGHLIIGLCRSGDELTRCLIGDLTLKDIEHGVFERYGHSQTGFTRITGLTAHAQRVLLRALSYANAEKKTLAGIAHIWQELLCEEGCSGLSILSELGKTIDGLRTALTNAVGRIERPAAAQSIASADTPLTQEEAEAVQRSEAQQREKAAQLSQEHLLETYARNLTKAAREGRLEPLIGRIDELDAMIRILGKKTKNNPLLIGEPGVGKSALAEGLAQRIVSGQVPPMLQDAQIYALDLTQIIAGSKFRGEFEERIKKLITALQSHDHAILFIDEIHTLIGAGSSSEGSLDAANILKPALARGELRVIGATTYREYRKYFEKDAALARRFQRIDVDEPDHQETLQILSGLKSRYESYHGVSIPIDTLRSAIDLSSRYVTDRYMPDKAIDLIDEAASMVKLSSWKGNVSSDSLSEVGVRDVQRVVSRWTGIPLERVSEDEAKGILDLEMQLSRRIIGQQEAVASISKALRRARAGLNDPSRPLGVFMLLGPSGVGKTELCKALSEALFGSEDSLIRIDMSEYSEESSASRLIGSPPGYVGHGEGGQLTDAVMKKPYSIVLFDEIEKANAKVFSLLLQLLDDGHLTDSLGHKVNFKNTIVVMTSNTGVSFDSEKRLGFCSKPQAANPGKAILSKLKETFRPEFLGRIDELIIMNSLTQDDGRRIADLMLGKIVQRLAQQGIMLEFDEQVARLLAEKGVDAMSGARNLRRVIAREIEDPLSDLILSQDLTGETIAIRTEHDSVCMQIVCSDQREPVTV